MRKHIKKTIIIFTTIILVVQLLLISVSAAGTIYDYNSYVVNSYVDGENDVVTVELPPIYNTNGFWRYRIGTGNFVTSQSYRVGFVGTAGESINLEAWLLGNDQIKASNIPNNTEYTYIIDLRTNASSDTWSFNVSAYVYMIAYNATGEAVYYNKSNTITLQDGSNTFTGKFYKGPNNDIVGYCPVVVIPSITGTGDNMLLQFNAGYITMSVNSQYRQLEQAFVTNNLLGQLLAAIKDLFNSNEETNDWLEQIKEAIDGGDGAGSAYDDKKDEADDLIDQMDSMNKPDAGDAVDQADPFSVISQEQYGEFSDIFEAILNQEIVRNMLLIGIMLALVSLVLFGKKG